MFGPGVLTEITSNILSTPGYPRPLTLLISIFIAIIPLTKVPLASRPINSTLETLLSPSSPPSTPLLILLRTSTIILVVIVAIIFPAFDSIMAFMGSSLCFSICVILPLLFHLRIFKGRIVWWERWVNYALVGISAVLAVVGTVWAFLPRAWIGEEGV
jgi:vesicular inhibitory amino acid transporter